MSSKGFTPIIILVVILVSLLGVVAIGRFLPKTIILPTPSPTPTSTSRPTPTPTVIPTPTSTPTFEPTVKPTAKPVVTPAPISGPPGSGISTINVATEKGNFLATVMSFDLSGVKVITDSANDSDCTNNCAVTNLQNFVNKNSGFAGINGTYFCPSTYSECSAKTNSFDFPIYNSPQGHWINGGNLFWNDRAIFYIDGSGSHYLQNAKDFSGGLTAGIVNFPGLVADGNVQIDDAQSGLSDKQKSVGVKVGIGLRNGNNVMVVVAQNVNMQQFAYVFKSLGAIGALNLDTGGSTALFYGGHYVYGPGRDIPNAIIFGNR